MRALLIRGLGGLMASSLQNSDFASVSVLARLLTKWAWACASVTLHIWILQSNCSVLMRTPRVGVRQLNCLVQLNRCNSGTFCFNSIILVANCLGFTLVEHVNSFVSYFFNTDFRQMYALLDCDCFLHDVDIAWSEMAIPNERKGKDSELMAGDCSIRKVIYSLASVNSWKYFNIKM